jgi:hypothetical protein
MPRACFGFSAGETFYRVCMRRVRACVYAFACGRACVRACVVRAPCYVRACIEVVCVWGQ